MSSTTRRATSKSGQDLRGSHALVVPHGVPSLGPAPLLRSRDSFADLPSVLLSLFFGHLFSHRLPARGRAFRSRPRTWTENRATFPGRVGVRPLSLLLRPTAIIRVGSTPSTREPLRFRGSLRPSQRAPRPPALCAEDD